MNRSVGTAVGATTRKSGDAESARVGKDDDVTEPEKSAPLTGVRVLDLTVGEVERVARLLADLGADVLKIEPRSGGIEQTCLPLGGMRDIGHALRNANKRRVELDPSTATDRVRFQRLVETCDILIDSGRPGRAQTFGSTARELADADAQLVVMSVTDFGCTGPRASWRATDAVLAAMSSVLSRSGPPGGMPVLPPRGIASATAAAQAAWAVLAAYYYRLNTGRGEYIDFSRYEAVLQALDPPFGAQGQAAAARGTGTVRRGRPTRQDAYPIFECQDGWVRICVLAPRQWRAMRAWLGEPPEFQDTKYDTISARAVDFDRIGAAIAALFAVHTADELVEIGAARGVPVAAILTPPEVLTADHFQAVKAWRAVELDDQREIVVPDGCIVIDGQRAGVRWLAQTTGNGTPEWIPAVRAEAPVVEVTRPLEGLTILDLGVIVAGGELARLFGDMGAEVIKIESPHYPDGLRQARPGQIMSESFAWARRNQLALGLDLRNSAGAEVFGRLVAHADAIFANFKPGTLDSLGFDFERLRRLNPGVVLTESSAYGDTGPWRTRLGYGPLVRAATGITSMWTDSEDPSADGGRTFSDAVTVFPDHLVARLAATATLAALIARRTTGEGAHIHISQAETAVSQLDSCFATAWARENGEPVSEDWIIDGVYPCLGDDEWCVITISSDAEWSVIAELVGNPGLADDNRFSTMSSRLEHRDDLRALIATWTGALAVDDVADALQLRGVPAGPMLRATDVLSDPQVTSRGVYVDMYHPLLDGTLPAEIGPAPYRRIPPPEQRPAPRLGEHTVDVCRRVLGMTLDEIDQLLGDAVLFSSDSITTPVKERTA